MYRQEKLVKLNDLKVAICSVFCSGNINTNRCISDCIINKISIDNADQFTFKDIFDNYDNIQHIKFIRRKK